MLHNLICGNPGSSDVYQQPRLTSNGNTSLGARLWIPTLEIRFAQEVAVRFRSTAPYTTSCIVAIDPNGESFPAYVRPSPGTHPVAGAGYDTSAFFLLSGAEGICFRLMATAHLYTLVAPSYFQSL